MDDPILDFIKVWALGSLIKVERELKKNPKSLSKNAQIALEVNDLLAGAMRRHERFPQLAGKEIISYRGGDTWKYQFVSPLLVTRQAAEWLWTGKSGREKATRAFPKLKFQNSSMVTIYGEHNFPTAQQREHLPKTLFGLVQAGGVLKTKELPNTYLAYELLYRNIIECRRADETISQSKDPVWGGRGRRDDSSMIVNTRWIRSSNCFDNRPEHLDKISEKIKNEMSPKNFDDFWNALTQPL
jgi:hypothetical protein